MQIQIHSYDKDFLEERALISEREYMPLHVKNHYASIGRLYSFADDCMRLTVYYAVIAVNLSKASNYFLLQRRALTEYFQLALKPEGTTEKVILSPEWSFEIEARPAKNYTDCS